MHHPTDLCYTSCGTLAGKRNNSMGPSLIIVYVCMYVCNYVCMYACMYVCRYKQTRLKNNVIYNTINKFSIKYLFQEEDNSKLEKQISYLS